MHPAFKAAFLKATGSSTCEEIEIIQSLWSGYGKVSRYHLDGSSSKTVIVKHISLNQSNAHPRGWDTAFSHNRKVESYKVEIQWYEQWSQLCSNDCTIPKFLASYSEGDEQWIVLEDLNVNFPLIKNELTFSEIKVCLSWLANFHASFLNQKPTGLWEVGTYWNLQTRPDEFEKMEHPELKAKAKIIDEILNNCKYQTIVHGDAKLANFCFSQSGKKVAAVDFQYVGGGCGMKDLAYFFGSCLSSQDCAFYEQELLNFYFSVLEKALKDNKEANFSFKELELEWRQLYPVACTDFTRFLLGWMPTHQKLNKYNLDMMESVLEEL